MEKQPISRISHEKLEERQKKERDDFMEQAHAEALLHNEVFDKEGPEAYEKYALSENEKAAKLLFLEQGVDDLAIKLESDKDQSLSKRELMYIYGLRKRYDYDQHGGSYRPPEGDQEKAKEFRTLRENKRKEDLSVIYGFKEEEIALSSDEINESTKLYGGPLEKGIFERFADVGHPVKLFEGGGEVSFEKISVGGKSKEELLSELKSKGVDIDDSGTANGKVEKIINKNDFAITENPEEIVLVRLVGSFDSNILGLEKRNRSGEGSLEEMLERAEALGLETCPDDAALHYRIAHSKDDQKGLMFVTKGFDLLTRIGRSYDDIDTSYDTDKKYTFVSKYNPYGNGIYGLQAWEANDVHRFDKAFRLPKSKTDDK